jgi:hypothetical protein
MPALVCLSVAMTHTQQHRDIPGRRESVQDPVSAQSRWARLFYDKRRNAGDVHHQALRALDNRLVGILHSCLRHRTHYDEHKASAHRQTPATQAA